MQVHTGAGPAGNHTKAMRSRGAMPATPNQPPFKPRPQQGDSLKIVLQGVPEQQLPSQHERGASQQGGAAAQGQRLAQSHP